MRTASRVLGGAAFVLLATMNAAGYRYGASDQSYYIPFVLRHLNPSLFPRDAVLIDAQARLTGYDDLFAAIIRVTGVSLQTLFFVCYVATLLLLFWAVLRLGSRFYRSPWTTAALAAALTLRHAIAKTGTNTLEGYFHPRQLAFALGLLSLTAFLDRRTPLTVALLLVALVLHPTTAAWFIVWLTVTAWFSRPAWRPALASLTAVAIALGVAALWRGPLAGHFARMDPAWLAVISDRDYLFPTGWPLTAWLTNLVTIPVILVCWRARARAGVTIAGETPLVIGAMALALLFFCWLPFDIARVAIAVELQPSRLFWLLDVYATLYLVWALAEAKGTRARAVAIAVVLLSLTRGAYTSFVQFPGRPIFALDIQNADWRDAMAFARTTDPGSGWLANPAHAAMYGSSVRAAGERDVLLDALKDPAVAMYDRDAAMRIGDRQRALKALPWDTADGARALARRYDLDYLVIDRELALPLAHRSGSLFVYKIR
jgi:hypothetical protein